jgi:long-chain acyl-CoA synthetase
MQNMKEHDERDAIAQTTGEGEDLLDTRPWVKHYEQELPAHLSIPDRPLTWLLDHTADHYPDHIAFIYLETKLTYAQFARYANRFASSLQRLGVKKGDRVAIALPNIPQYPIAFYGALKAGAKDGPGFPVPVRGKR